MSASDYKYTDALVEVKGRIGIIKLNRPKALNAFSTTMMLDVITALRELNEHPATVFTVLTGEGRFFSSGVDVKAVASRPPVKSSSLAERKIASMTGLVPALEMLRSLIDHQKVLVLALNGPAVGGGAAWFEGAADLFLAAEGSWLQVPFNSLGLVPENGSTTLFSHHIGVRRANEFLMFGRRATVEELETWGLVNRVFPKENFHGSVLAYLEKQLEENDGKSMMETKRLQNLPLRRERMLAVYDSVDALAEKTLDGASVKRFEQKNAQLSSRSKGQAKL
ncbi:hypothetical protein CLAIMM_13450 [Cladophialophora immunda]|nr:hypothetical protein CLAIMM_13450 [Cladophialophora immunda]